MGLAASQARFLGLTARKSNAEYQAQQINQMRTALANEISGMYSDYNKLQAPTPPSIYDYTTTSYTLDATYQQYEVSSFTKITSGENAGYYNVILKYDKQLPMSYGYVAKGCIVDGEQTTPGDYSKLKITIGANTYTYDSESTETSDITKINDGDDYSKYEGLETVKGDLGNPPYYMFKMGDKYCYASGEELSNFDSGGDYTFYYQGFKTKEETVSAIASIETASNSRLMAMNFIKCDDDPALVGNSYDVTTTKKEDQQAYDNAMNNYNYQQTIYRKRQEEINLKTEDLQQQDKTLELKLNQIDTEQNAISTEMDSISKVIEDTIESVFKTFS